MNKQKIKEIASIAWKGAANAFRMYPNNSHTFVEYWSGAESQFDEYVQYPQPSETKDAEKILIKHGIQMPQQNLINAMEEYAQQNVVAEQKVVSDEQIEKIYDALSGTLSAYQGVGDFEGTGELMTIAIGRVKEALEIIKKLKDAAK